MALLPTPTACRYRAPRFAGPAFVILGGAATALLWQEPRLYAPGTAMPSPNGNALLIGLVWIVCAPASVWALLRSTLAPGKLVLDARGLTVPGLLRARHVDWAQMRSARFRAASAQAPERIEITLRRGWLPLALPCSHFHSEADYTQIGTALRQRLADQDAGQGGLTQ